MLANVLCSLLVPSTLKCIQLKQPKEIFLSLEYQTETSANSYVIVFYLFLIKIWASIPKIWPLSEWYILNIWFVVTDHAGGAAYHDFQENGQQNIE